MVELKVENVENSTSEKPKINKKRAKEAISVLKKLNEVFFDNKSKKSLLDDGSESKVYLQVTLNKIPPKKLKAMIKVQLPHSLKTDTTDVCLITGDLEKNNKKAEIEPTVLHYKDLLKKQNVKGIAEVVPLRQIRTEYKTFESKRQLAGAYDIFINDKKITGCLPKVLGKAFYDSRKFPIQINFGTSNLKDQIEKALSQTTFSLSCRGNSCTTEIALLSMEVGHILENILSCIEILAEKVPGKWANVKGLYIKTARSEAIPIYVSYDNPNELKVKAPRHQEKVKAEELSTVRNAAIKVFKDGRISIKNLPDSDDESNEVSTKKDVAATSENEAIEVPANEAGVKSKTKKKRTSVLDNTSDNEVNVEHIIADVDVKTKNKRKKTKMQEEVDEADDIEVPANKAGAKSKTKKKRTSVSDNTSNNVVNVEHIISDVDVKTKNKRKKTKVQKEVDEADDIPTEDVKPKVKKMKTKVLVQDVSDDEVTVVNSPSKVEFKPKGSRKIKKSIKVTMEAKDETCANKVDKKSKIKRRDASINVNEGKVKDSTNEVGNKLKNKRKKTKELVDITSNNEEESGAIEDVPKIKRRKTKK